jgi:hypothetical protein
MNTYSEKLKDPRWQRKRLEIMQLDNFTCTVCEDKENTLNVHHWEYSKEPWDAKNEDLTTVCRSCHEKIEHCKALTKSFLRRTDFRDLVTNMERILNVCGNIYIDCDRHDMIFIYPKIMIPNTYRFLEEGELIEAGDEFYFAYGSSSHWQVYGRAVGQRYIPLCNYAGRRKKQDALSDFDRLIESSPDEDEEA